ncbi:MAG: hemolysin family protein, partial [Deltaproteobacteria bacterium]|nr:hemolysin family protein [Deltaproteobacteria bacterium]
MEIPVKELVGICVCLVLSAFFSGSETALTALSEIRLEKLIKNHPKWARPLLMWRKNPNGVLTTILVGNNIVNITASALATDLASSFLPGSSGIPLAVGAMTFLLLLFGEITPKTFARTYAETLAPLLMHGVVVFHWVFYPAAWVLTQFVKGLIFILGVREKKGRTLTEEDIEFIVSMGRRQGVLDKDKEHLLTSVFEFSDTTVKEIMKPRTEMEALSVESSYEEVLALSQQSGFSRIPVFDGSLDNIVGIFYIKSLLAPPSQEKRGAFLRDNLRPPVFVPESKKINELLRMFQKNQIHMAVVVDEFGGT